MFDEPEYEGIFLTDSMKALEVFNDRPYRFDLIVTDFKMPNLNGRALAKEIRAIRMDLPIILVTGNTNVSADDIRNWGIDELILKPYHEEQMRSVVQRVLDFYTTPYEWFPSNVVI